MSRRGMTSQLWWLSIVENSPGVEDECSKPMKRAFNTVITRKCNDQEKNMLAEAERRTRARTRARARITTCHQ